MEQVFIAYYRVSTGQQGQSGLGLEAQRETVRRYAEQRGQVVEEFTEIERGTVRERPQLHAALAACRRRGAVLLIAKLDRLARTVSRISTLMDGNVKFVACDLPEANRLTLHMLAAVAEYERELISSRTKAALAAAKARGVQLGNPRPAASSKLATAAVIAGADQFAAKLAPVILGLQAQGMTSLRQLADMLNDQGIATRRGGTWHASTVSCLLKRLRSPG